MTGSGQFMAPALTRMSWRTPPAASRQPGAAATASTICLPMTGTGSSARRPASARLPTSSATSSACSCASAAADTRAGAAPWMGAARPLCFRMRKQPGRPATWAASRWSCCPLDSAGHVHADERLPELDAAQSAAEVHRAESDLLEVVQIALDLHALGTEDRDENRWAPQGRTDRQLGLERSPRLGHMTGRNWFFAALVKDAREHGGELAEWLNEADPAARAEPAAVWVDDRLRLPPPARAGNSAEDGQRVNFLLEYDGGTEHWPGSWTATGCWPPGWPGMGSPARCCCSASARRAGGRPPAPTRPPPRTAG